MEFATLTAKPRAERGKGPARRLRHEGQIPAVAYGRSLKSMPVAVDPNALLKILQGPLGLNTVMKLSVAGEGASDLLVMVREFTHHPVTRKFLHADFIQVKLEEDVEVDVPFIVHGKPLGVVAGGVLNQIFRKLPIRTRPNNIPLKLEAEISHLELGTALKVNELKLPEGVRVRLPQDQSIVAVVAPEKDRSAEEDAAAAAAGASGAGTPAPAGAAAGAAPAAGGKPGAAPAAAAAGAKGAAPAADAKAPAKKK